MRRAPADWERSAAEDAHIPRCKHRRTSDVAESIADPNSYGFRKDRSTADAIGQCFIALGKKHSPQWILEGDIKACFDKISHSLDILDCSLKGNASIAGASKVGVGQVLGSELDSFSFAVVAIVDFNNAAAGFIDYDAVRSAIVLIEIAADANEK